MSVIRMVDIAKAANVSVTTVARVIHNKGYVSEETRRRVEEVINQLGYVPNKVARALKDRRTKMIGHVLPYSHVINPFFTQVQSAIDRAAQSKGYHVLTITPQQNSKMIKKLVEDLIGHMVSGIVFTGDHVVEPELLKWLISIGVHIVMIERPKDVFGVDKVLINNIEGSFLAVSHIIERGHKRIAFVGKDPDKSVERDRFAGYEQTLKQAGIELVKEYIKFMPEYEVRYGYEAMKEIMEKSNPPTAVFLASDIFACGAMQYLYQKKIRIPDDISLVGYDDSLAEILSPPITSVAFPMDEIGKLVIEMMEERIVEKRINAKSITLSPILVDRNSVKHLK